MMHNLLETLRPETISQATLPQKGLRGHVMDSKHDDIQHTVPVRRVKCAARLEGRVAGSFQIYTFTVFKTSVVSVHTHKKLYGEGDGTCQDNETNNFIPSTVVENAWIFTTMPTKTFCCLVLKRN
jgi:hypothetical protein